MAEFGLANQGGGKDFEGNFSTNGWGEASCDACALRVRNWVALVDVEEDGRFEGNQELHRKLEGS